MRKTHVQALILDVDTNNVLMVRQYVYRGEIVWTLPGGGVEEGETYREACIREVKEETGYDIEVGRILIDSDYKVVYEAFIIGGEMYFDSTLEDNSDIIEIGWQDFYDDSVWDNYTTAIRSRYEEGIYGRI